MNDKRRPASYGAAGSLRVDVSIYRDNTPVLIMDMKVGAKGNRISDPKWLEYERRFGATMVTIGIKI